MSIFKLAAYMGDGYPDFSYVLAEGSSDYFQSESREIAVAFRHRMRQRYPLVRFEVHELDPVGTVVQVLP